MDRKEKNRLKAEISEHIDLGNGRYKDYEVEQLRSLVENRDAYNGQSRTYRKSYKSYDSEDTYHVEETDTIYEDGFGVQIPLVCCCLKHPTEYIFHRFSGMLRYSETISLTKDTFIDAAVL